MESKLSNRVSWNSRIFFLCVSTISREFQWFRCELFPIGFGDYWEVWCNSRLWTTYFPWEMLRWNLVEMNFRGGINCEFRARVFFRGKIEITVWLWNYARRRIEQFRRIEKRGGANTDDYLHWEKKHLRKSIYLMWLPHTYLCKS